MHVSAVKCLEITPAGWWKGELVFDLEGYKQDKIQYYSSSACLFIKAMQFLHLDRLFGLRTIEISDVTGKTYQMSRKSSYLWLRRNGDSRFQTPYEEVHHVIFSSSEFECALKGRIKPLHQEIAARLNTINHFEYIMQDRSKRPQSSWSILEREVDTKIEKLREELIPLKAQLDHPQ